MSPIVIGTRQSLPELEEGLQGPRAGETRTGRPCFPGRASQQNLAGQTGELQVTVKRVEEQSLPPVDEEFCRAYGVEEGGVEALRPEVRKSMEREFGRCHPQPPARRR